MSVLKGEGKVPILFTTTSVNVGPVTRTGYLSRPDLTGEWPTILLVPSAWGVTSSVKDICRRLARQGFAVIAPDLFRGKGPARDVPRQTAVVEYERMGDSRIRDDLDVFMDFISNRAGFWSSAEDGFGVFGLGTGGRHAATAVAEGRGDALALAYSPVRPHEEGARGVLDFAQRLMSPLLGLYGRSDEIIPVDDVLSLRELCPHGEFVLYEDVGHDFLDDYLAEYDAGAASDALERISAFFTKHLPQGPPAGG